MKEDRRGAGLAVSFRPSACQDGGRTCLMRARRLVENLWQGTLFSLEGWVDDQGVVKR